MNIKEIKKSLSTKLKLHQSEHSAHTDYCIVLAEAIIPLPRLIRVSHGGGETPNKQIGGIARGLGMSESNFKTMVKCHIRKSFVDLSIAVKLLMTICEDWRNQGAPMRPGMKAMAESIGLVLGTINPKEICSTDKTAGEEKVIVHIRKLLRTVENDSLLSDLVRQINLLLGEESE